jgi:hypothetical protein
MEAVIKLQPEDCDESIRQLENDDTITFTMEEFLAHPANQ